MLDKLISYRPCLIILIGITSIILVTATYFGLEGLLQQTVSWDKTKILTYISLALFLMFCSVGLWKEQYYFLLLPFILIAFPSPVNDLFPGTYLGFSHERGNALFPFITHIDFYLFLGVVKNALSNKKWKLMSSGWIVLVGISMGISIVWHFAKSSLNEVELLHLLIAGLFQYRFLILLFLLVGSTQSILKYGQQIITGFAISIIFLVIEATVNTLLAGQLRLVSGTLSLNTFANILGQMIVMMILFYKPHRRIEYTLRGGAIFLGTVGVVLTQTRMALLIFILMLLLVTFITKIKQKWFASFGAIVIVFMLIVGYVEMAEKLPKRFNFVELSSKFSGVDFSSGFQDAFDLELNAETSSLITRISLFQSSFNMIEEQPYVGIGVGRWNYLKQDYGFEIPVLIDAHNGYLAILSQYGLFGIPLLIFIYFLPLFYYYKLRNTETPLKYLAFINFGMAFCELSNAGIMKYQVFALLTFNTIVLIKLNLEKNNTGQEEGLKLEQDNARIVS